MIQNIIVPMPITMYGRGEESPKMVIALLSAILIIGMINYVIGYLKDGIKYSDWGLNDNNLWKMFGISAMFITLGVILLVGFALLVYSWL